MNLENITSRQNYFVIKFKYLLAASIVACFSLIDIAAVFIKLIINLIVF